MTGTAIVAYAGLPDMIRRAPRSDLPFRRHASAWAALVVASALLTLTGCPGRGGPDFGQLPTITSDDPKADAELRRARELDEQGREDDAEAAYRAFIARHPKDPLVPIAQLALGRLLLAKEQLPAAKREFEQVSRHPDPAVAEQGRFYGAVAAGRLGDHATAVKVLQPMIGRPIDPADTSLLLRTLAEAYIGLARYADAAITLDALAAPTQPEADRTYARTRSAELIRDKASAADVRRLYDELSRDGAVWPNVVRRAIRDADAAGETDRVRELIEVMREHDLPIDESLAAIAVRAERPAEADPQIVGAVLSLSGRGRKVGELALRGLMLAAGLPLEGPPEPGAPQLVFRDDGGDPERAVAAVEELVAVHRVIAIIGPMDARAAEAAAIRAEELGVPLLSLSPAPSARPPSSMTYRMFGTPAEEVRSLLAAAKNQGRTRIAALLPVGGYGDLIESLLRAEAAKLSASLVTVPRYAPETTSFVEHAQTLAKQNFDALLLADGPEHVTLISPALAAAGLWCGKPGSQAPQGGRVIGIYAPAVAFDPGLARRVGRYLQGAVFSMQFDAQVAQGAARTFADRFQAQFSEPPDAFAALAHDAYKLVRAGVASGGQSRKALADALPRVESSDLAGPGRGLSRTHEPRNATRLLTLVGETFTELE